MFGNSMPAIQAPTEKGRALVKILRYMLYGQLTFGCLKLFSGGFGTGLGDLIACWILYQAYTYLNHCNVIIYGFFNGVNAIQLLAIVGVAIQNSESLFHNSHYKTGSAFLPSVEYLSFFLYCISLYFAFHAYREFKAITLELMTAQAGGGFGDYERGTELNQYRPPQRGGNATSQDQGSRGAGQHKHFTGKGVTIG